MAQTPFSLLHLRRLALSSRNHKLPCTVSFFLSQLLTTKAFSTSQTPPMDPKPSSLSARMSFVFDQIDAIEKDRSQKDQTLQRIRAWRESKKTQIPQNDMQIPESGSGLSNDIDYNSKSSDSAAAKMEVSAKGENGGESVKKKVELVHPWPEWIEFMERLVQQNYFDHRRKDEDKMVQDLGFDMAEAAEDIDFDFTKDFKTVQTACLNFGKDRFDIFRSLSRRDIQMLVGFGCPTVDKKVVFSAKLLRKHVHLDEGDVCSSCSLRNSCERAYLLTNKEDEARSIDVMRVLLAFGFDPVNGIINKSVLKQKSVKTTVRKLLHEVVKLSSVPIDPNLPPPVIKRPPPKVKQPPPPPKKRVGRDDVEMKKGDWLCPKCDFMNFAKNTVCLQCDAKRPKRQLLPGEWECPECNFLNYRRNMACFHCDCKRPQDEFLENKMPDKQHGFKPRLDKIASRTEVSNAWNFDFDDNESDGADVATFEYADSRSIHEDSPIDGQYQGGNFRVPEGDFRKGNRLQRTNEGGYTNPEFDKPGTGFDDFEDEDEDDIDSYELETHNNSLGRKASSNDFSESEGYSKLEDSDSELLARHKSSLPNRKQSRSKPHKAAFSSSEDEELDFDSDEELSVHPNWKSSHVADSRQQQKDRGPVKKLSFGSDEELGLYSDEDGNLNDVHVSKQNKGKTLDSGRSNFHKRRVSDIEDDLFSGSESEYEGRHNRFKGKKGEPSKGGNSLNGRDSRQHSNGAMGGRRNTFDDDFNGSSKGSRGNVRGSRSSGVMGGRRNTFDDDFNGSSKRSHGNGRGSRGHDDNWRRFDDREGNMRNFKGSRREGFGKNQHELANGYDRDADRDVGEFKNRRRVIER
ncbi:Zinc finger protein VAR3, chloroplastic [Quillaja saponaria]|uniref:Zinc finger protein VAR3, chloroplastic n=1 Tax=Quillaja saponaria TaxID=32244 RepID=A0AAD7QAT2_QUISA|nr:Zinc finger protein VAR3, chloroplastic [Quillaja saponaria]